STASRRPGWCAASSTRAPASASSTPPASSRGRGRSASTWWEGRSPTRATVAPSRPCSAGWADAIGRSDRSRRSSTTSISRTGSTGGRRRPAWASSWPGSMPWRRTTRSASRAAASSSTTSMPRSRPGRGRPVDEAPARASAGGGEPRLVSPRPSLRAFALYFLRLGATGFGGPIALAGDLQRTLAAERGWTCPKDSLDGLALAQLAPGPLAAQLAMYLGFTHSGLTGASVVAVAFILPSFLIVWALSAAYVRFGGLPWMRAAFYGIGAAVIAVIARSAWRLARLTLGRHRLR